MSTTGAAAKKNFKLPHVIAFLFIMVLIVIGLTWVIPAGEYERTTVTVEGIKQVRVVAGTYREVPPAPQAVWAVLSALVRGFDQSAGMIFMVFFCGAAVFILEKTGTVHVMFQRLIRKVTGREHWAIFAVMFMMSMGGATGAFANNTLALLPLGILLARGLGYDNVVGFGMIYLGSYSGFNVGWGNVFTIGIAQDIAELQRFSGLYVRVIFHAVNFILTYLLVARYASRTRRDPTLGLCYGESAADDIFADDKGASNGTDPILFRHVVCAATTILGFAAIIWGSVQWGWGVPQYSAVFLAIAILCGLCGGLGVNETASGFVKGCSTMVAGAFVIGIARAISVVMTDGKIIDSVVYYLAQPISHYGPVVGANLMFYANSLINFFIPSGSGQAVAVMPLMVPLADLSGITRQVAVQAFQLGDGFSNCIFPTAGVLMSSLALAKIPYGKYVKWFLPFILLQVVLSSIALTVLQSMGWN